MNPRRPLSPHLQIYKLPLTALLSIGHRLSGCLLLTAWLCLMLSFVYIVMGREAAWQHLLSLLESSGCKLIMSLWLMALSLHVVHGIRHLLWDLGLGLERITMQRSAIAEVLTVSLLAFFLASTIW